jgi:hypothetical protein
MEVRCALDYSAPAELFTCRSKKKSQGQVRYQRFNTAAEAIRFVVEEAPLSALVGTYLQVEEARFGRHEIQYLYENVAYPLKRT